MAARIFTCASCGVQGPCISPSRKYCDPCRQDKRREKMRLYARSNRRGTVIGSDFECSDCKGTFKRAAGSQRRCRECTLARRRKQTAEWKERTNYQNVKPGTKNRIGDTVTCFGCSCEFTKRVTYEKYCDPCKAISQQIRYREPWRKVQNSMSSRLTVAIRKKKAGGSWSHYFRYSLEELMSHLERQFLRGMTWENYGKWHIDHIVPVAAFDLTNDEDLIACFALTNLRPLWAKDNRKKLAQRLYLI